MKTFCGLPYIVLIVFFVLFYSNALNAKEKGIDVYGAIPPIAYVIEKIGGEYIIIHTFIQGGKDPHTFEPTPKQIAAIGKASAYFSVRLPFESQLIKKITSINPKIQIVDTTLGIKLHSAEAGHHYGFDVTRIHVELDPHIWLSPLLLKVQVRNIFEGLMRIDPNHAAFFNKNKERFIKDVEKTHENVKKILEPYRRRSFFVFHPAFGYFADTYDLIQVAIESEGKSPGPKRIALLIQKAKKENVKTIFVHSQFDHKSAKVIADAIGGSVVFVDPLARNVLTNLIDIAKMLRYSMSY